MSAWRIGAIRLGCPDPERTAGFYRDAFGCALAAGDGGGIAVSLGAQRIELASSGPAAAPRAPGNASAFQHCAIVVSDMAAAYRALSSVPGWSSVSEGGPQALPASSGGVSAFKFRDPDGHPLELLGFPPVSVPPAWRDKPGLFLGIDHTAISVTDTTRSIAFYEGLGFTVVSRGLNRGPEQARLDGLPAPVVDVIGLNPSGGAPPHLELLGYHEPAPIASALADADPLATRTVLVGEGPARETADPDGHRLVFATAL